MRSVDIVCVASVGIANVGFRDAIEDLRGEEPISGPAVESFDPELPPVLAIRSLHFS